MNTQKHPSRLDLYQRLIEISRDLVSTLDLTELLARIVNAAADLCQAEAASILLYNETTRELYFEAATNLENPTLRGMTVPVENSVAGWIVTNQQAVIINDAQHDTRHFNEVSDNLQMSIQTLMGVPLIAKGKVIGALEAINKIESLFDEDDLDLLSALGAQAAIAIENSRLFQQSDLIAELIHELRTPMASLNTAVYLLMRPEIDEAQRIYLANMVRSEISRLSELTTSFLDLARLESGRMQFNPQSFDLGQLLNDCTDLMRARAMERNIKIDSKIPADPTFVTADRDKIKQVVINLLSNAIKYNSTDGKIAIQAYQNGEAAGFSVEDTGPGIPANEMKHLFEKFYRVPGSENLASGTGLGLSICKRIIDAHQGWIDVDSKVGKGTKFSIFLPTTTDTRFKSAI
jgi:signal transduction histidine kinase